MKNNFKIEYFSPPDADDIFADVWMNGLYVMQVKTDSGRGSMAINFFNKTIGNDILTEDLDIVDFIEVLIAISKDLNPSVHEKILASITSAHP